MKDSKASSPKIFKASLWRAVSVATIFLSALCITATTVAYDYAPMVNSTLGIETSTVSGDGGSQYYTSEYDNVEDMFQAKVQLMREVGQEGTVLLKNSGVLPITGSSKSVTVINADSFVYANSTGGGSMSSSEVISTTVDLVTALKNDGLTVSTSSGTQASSDAIIVVIARASTEGNDIGADALELTASEITAISDAKAANYGNVILLISGDYYPEISNYVNDSGIGAIIKMGNAGYGGAYGLADVITGAVSPSGRLVDTVAVDSESSPAAQNCGSYEYTNKNKIMASQANSYVCYSEGIYTDYKYYETRYEDTVSGNGNASSTAGSLSGEWTYSNEVLYSYGYGLSYTTFTHEIVDEPVFNAEDHTATITVKVTNTGDYDGKEVVQVYGQSPYTDYDKQNNVEKSSVQLLGYGKTQTLKANGGTETLEITVHLQWLASYDYTTAKTYIMDAGDDYFSIGNGAHDALNNILAAKGYTTKDGMTDDGDASLTYKWTQSSLDTTTYSTSIYTGESITNRFDDVDINYWSEDAVTYLSRSDWEATWPETLTLTATTNMLSSLNDTKKYENGTWNDSKSHAASDEVSYVDLTTESDVNTAVSNGTLETQNVVSLRDKAYDDSEWDTILGNMTIYEMCRLVAEGRYYINACPSITFNSCGGDDGPNGVGENLKYYSIDPETGEKVALTSTQTMTDGIRDTEINISAMDCSVYSSEPVLAATFNLELAERIGAMYGEDGLYTGTSFLWGLGANIHRTPFAGRTSEYYSADSVQTTLTGSAVAKASKEHGVVLVVKHFVLNEQEQNRIGVATFTNEQAFRENYLRSFEGIATYGEMQGVMTSYNRVGLLSSTAEYDLVTGVLREEWGSQAYVITDLNSPTAGLYDGNAAMVAGVSTMMNNGTYNATSGSYVNCTLNVENVKSDATLLYAVRESCHRILYNFIHSNAVNGISDDSQVLFVTPWWQPTLIAIDVVITGVAVCAGAMYLISANKKKKKKEV